MQAQEKTQHRDHEPRTGSPSDSIEDEITSQGEADEEIIMSVADRIPISVGLNISQAQTSAAIANITAVKQSVNHGNASDNPALLKIESNWKSCMLFNKKTTDLDNSFIVSDIVF